MMSFVQEHGRQCMPCSTNFSVTLETVFVFFFPTETSDFLKQIIFLKSFNPMSLNDQFVIKVYSYNFRGSNSAILIFASTPSQCGSSLKGKNLLLKEQILSFKR